MHHKAGAWGAHSGVAIAVSAYKTVVSVPSASLYWGAAFEVTGNTTKTFICSFVKAAPEVIRVVGWFGIPLPSPVGGVVGSRAAWVTCTAEVTSHHSSTVSSGVVCSRATWATCTVEGTPHNLEGKGDYGGVATGTEAREFKIELTLSNNRFNVSQQPKNLLHGHVNSIVKGRSYSAGIWIQIGLVAPMDPWLKRGERNKEEEACSQ